MRDIIVTPADVARTACVLAELAARQDALGVELEATGLTDFADRADWLIAHRTPDEALAAQRRIAALERRFHVVGRAVPRAQRAVRFASLAVPNVRVPEAPDPLLAVALRVLETKSERERAGWARARRRNADAA